VSRQNRPESDCSPSRRSSGEQQVFVAELVVDPGMELIAIVDASRIGDVVEGGGAGVGRRIVFQAGDSDLPEARCRDNIAREGLPRVGDRIIRCWIENLRASAKFPARWFAVGTLRNSVLEDDVRSPYNSP